MAVGPQRIKAIFFAAMEKTEPSQRVSYLDEVCAGDAALRQRVDALVEAHDRGDQLLDRAAVEYLVAEEGQHNAVAVAEPTTDAGDSLDFLTPSPKPDSLGQLAHYEVLEIIGRGGMGIVLRAFDDKLHRIVAIKVLASSLAASGAARQRFLREARAAAAVTHDNVIAIHGVEEAGLRPYLVMQYIDGRTLQEKLDRSGPLPIAETLRIGLQIAEGLAAAHRQGLIHRDIKPANILLENSIERVRITDFGLARSVDDASLSQTGVVSGTPLYMSPEQACGEEVDGRTDLFSLGSVLYALCTGHSPFRAATSMAVLRRVCEDAPRPMREVNSDVPPWLETIVGRLLAKDPAERFQTAEEVAALLSRCLAQLRAGADPVDTGMPAGSALAPTRPSETPQRSFRIARPAFLGLVVVGLVAAFCLIFFFWFPNSVWEPSSRNSVSRLPTEVREGDAKRSFADGVPKQSLGTREGDKGGEQSAPSHSHPLVLKPSRTLIQHTKAVRALAISPNGKVLASAGEDWSIFLWDTATWKVRELRGHTGPVSALAFSPDSTRLASVSSDRGRCAIRLWDVAAARPAGELLRNHYGMWTVAYSPDGKMLACGGWDRKLFLFNLDSGQKPRVVHEIATRFVRQLSFSRDGRFVVTGGSGPTRLWDPRTGQEVPTELKLPNDICPSFFPNADEFAAWCYTAGTVTICGVPKGRVRAVWRAHAKTIEGLALSPDGRFLASVGAEGAVRLWTAADQSEVATLLGHRGRVSAAVFTPDGAQLLTAGTDFTIRLWDLPVICRISSGARRAAE